MRARHRGGVARTIVPMAYTGVAERIQINLGTYGETVPYGFDSFILQRSRLLGPSLATCWEEVTDYECTKVRPACRATIMSANHGFEDPVECLFPDEAGGYGDWCHGVHTFANGYQYRIKFRDMTVPNVVPGSRVADILFASEMPLSDVDDALIWTVGCVCPGDLVATGASAGRVDTFDLTKFLSQFGQTQVGCTPSILLGDLNIDGSVDSNDLTIFIGTYGTVCCTPEPPPTNCACPNEDASAAGTGNTPSGIDGVRENGAVGSPDATSVASTLSTPPGPVLAALGFSSAEAFQGYVDTLSDAELKVYLVLVLQVAQSLEGPTP